MNATLDTCSLCNGCTPRKVHAKMGSYPSSRKIMLVGEAPGEKEYECGEPFRGRAGVLLGDALTASFAALGWHPYAYARESMFISNAVKCWPHECTGFTKVKATATTEEWFRPRFKNLTPSKEMVDNCRHWLWTDIVHYKPKLIISLGKTAEKSLRMLRDEQADIIDEMGIRFAHVWHPAYVLRKGGDKSEAYQAWIAQWKEALKGGVK